jgi:RimJ/RimL family protein N-acetyltransferase
VTSARGLQPILHGGRVLLRPWTAGDADVVYAICQDPQIQRWTTVPSPYQRADAVSYVSEIAPQAWQDGGAVFAVGQAQDGRVLGTIGSHTLRDGVAHVGYWTAPDARKQGYTCEALRVLTHWFLYDHGAARVELVTEPDNVASRGVAESVGFTAEGVLRSRLVLRGRRADALMYSMLPSDSAARALRTALPTGESGHPRRPR